MMTGLTGHDANKNDLKHLSTNDSDSFKNWKSNQDLLNKVQVRKERREEIDQE